MCKHVRLTVVLMIVVETATAGAAQPVALERYLLAGDLNNAGTAGGPAAGNENLSFVTLASGTRVAENSLSNYSVPTALVNLHAQVPPGLRAVRVAAWIKTTGANGIIRCLHGTGMWGDREIPSGITLSLARGRLAWDAEGFNARSHHLRGVRRVNDGRWHHMAAVSQLAHYPWSVVALYVDGRLDAWQRDYDCSMTPQKVDQDNAFGFPGQMSRLELQDLSAGPSYFAGTGEAIQAAAADPLYDATALPVVEPSAPAAPIRKGGVVCVDDFGAAGNGVADDTEAMLKAVAVLDPAHGVDTLFLSSGTYKVSKPIEVPSGVDVVGLGATLRGEGVPAVALIGQVHDVSFRGVRFYGGPPAAVYQHGGTARHLYFERCDFSAPGDGKPVPNDANNYRGRTSDGILFTDVHDSTLLGCTATAGRAGIAVEGRMRNLSVVRCLIQHGSNLTGFYFDAPDSGPGLLLNNTVNCNMGYALTARAVQDLVVRGLSTEGMGVGLPGEALTGPMFDLHEARRADLELISLATLQLNRPGYQHQTWEGPQLRLNGRDNTIAGAHLYAGGQGPTSGLVGATLESDDPNLVLWQLGFGKAKLNLTGAAGRRALIAAQFLGEQFRGAVLEGEQQQDLASGAAPLSPSRRLDPPTWGPPTLRFTWGEMGLKSVRDYGAKGDGRTDDSEAFCRAAALEDVVYVPAGTYRLGRPMPPVSMVGEGRDRSILVADATCPGIVRSGPDQTVTGAVLSDLTLRGGQYCFYILGNTSGWLVSRVRFENPQVAGFAVDSFDHGNVLVDCDFVGGQYGFIAAGWNRHFIDKITLWRCNFTGQSENGIRIASVDGAPGLFLHTMLRDCTVRNTGGSGVVLMGHAGLFNFLDHCLIENCGQRDGAPYVSFIQSGNATALMYHSRVIHTQGPQPPVMVDVAGHQYTRFVDVTISGAKGAVALRSQSAQAWLESVTADGSLQAPPGVCLIATAGSSPLPQPPGAAEPTGLWLVERSRWGQGPQPVH